ncbi:MAG: ABC transporter transmembrane domain-containing protein, partial [Gammaproteobacteria bacterium]|nr:ABC transporter transmembrane domain-containing protein [Gammaproteobacteria bacterium]
LYRYILSHTLKGQIHVIVLTAISMPFVYFSLEIPKLIINRGIGGEGIPEAIAGIEVTQISYLMLLCALFLLLVILNGGLKYVINVYRGLIGERTLRRFRYELYSRVLRFPLPHFKRVSQGQIIPMITAETEPLGGFIGDAFALPAFQGGLLLTYLLFIFAQDPLLGLVATALYPFQLYVIPKLQRKINALAKRRVQTVRKLADRIGEGVSGATEIHAHDTSHYERADIAERLGTIFSIRLEIFRRKFFIKFLNNFLAQIAPFFFYSAGGYFVIQGNLSLGALVAVLAATRDLADPWKELLKYYQISADVRVKYAAIIEQFQPPDIFDSKIVDEVPEDIEPLQGDLSGTNVGYGEDEFTKAVEGASFNLSLDQSVAIVGSGRSGKDELTRLMARLVKPTSGRITLANAPLAELPEAVLGGRMAYVGADAYMFFGSIRDNLVYGLKHQPLLEPTYDEAGQSQRQKDKNSARETGNSVHDVRADWVDYEAAGCANALELDEKILDLAVTVDFESEIYELGLSGSLDPQSQPELTASILQARSTLRDRLQDQDYAPLVELFDKFRYNTNMNVAENLLFGTPKNTEFDLEKLSTNQYVRKILDDHGITDDLIEIGHQVAGLMVELFADVDAQSDLFEQYSFISADDLPTFKGIVGRASDGGISALPDDERALLLSLPFKLIPARHRLGLIDSRIQTKLLEARKAFAEGLKDPSSIDFFNPDQYNPSISIQDNILFGKPAYGQAHAQAKLGELVRDTLESLNLRRDVMRVGLDYAVGVAGARLSQALRQKLAIGRCLLKRPDLLIVNDATASLDPSAELRVLENLVNHMKGRGLIWGLSRPELARYFDVVIVMDNGKLVERGSFDELQQPGRIFMNLLSAAS